ncbi:thermitase [Marininema halotolerans]|uniref:Thermitase n=1 Tax=Marininema halotolerans TaxID=1155944 RepID=A0A1I6SME0_9BACL|nr:S8 family peptidase [Marininema halotolerans]SFS78116.1 thermitase [Marininema halotolerans]
MNSFKKMTFALAAMGLALSVPLTSLHAEAASKGSHAISSDSIIVKFKNNPSQAKKKSLINKVGSQLVSENKKVGFSVVKVKGKSVKQALKEYRNMSNVEYAEPRVTYHATWTPNDPMYASDQYGPQKMSLPQAWDITKGSSNVTVAVVDTGVQANHPDLSGKVVQGYDFVDNDSNANDENGHGTHVAGTIAANTNNGVGVAGVAPNVKIMGVRVLDAEGSGTNDAVADGITYAADHGAKVINMSLGGADESQAIEDAVNYAWNKGVVIVCAAGNESTSSPSYPAYYSKSIAVAATDSNDKLAYFSNYGSWVDVAAPGVDIMSTYIGSKYESLSGTSMASPHVAGLAGLLASQGLSNTQIRAAIENTSDTVSGTGSKFAHGRVNAYKALKGESSVDDSQDAYEPNNSFSQAYGISSGSTYNSKINSSSDIDYYKFTSKSSGYINLNLTNLPDDYDLYLYNSNGQQLTKSWNGGTSSESISYYGYSGTYYAIVVGYDGAYSSSKNYSLKASYK